MRDWKWALLALLGLALILLFANNASAQGMWVHGIVQDVDTFEAVPGGTIRIEHEIPGGWEIERISIEMQGHAFGWNLTKSGWYAVYWEKPGWKIDEDAGIRYGEFTLANAPSGDIVVNVRRVTEPAPAPTATPGATPTPWPTFPVPTTLYPPTVNPTPTATPTPTAVPCLEFQQFSWIQRRAVIDNAVLPHNRQLEDKLDWDNDLTLVFGLRDQLLGMPGSRRFEVTVGGETLTARAFCSGILTMRPVLREECMNYGIITWDGTQNWMDQ